MTVSHSPLWSTSPGIMVASFMSGPGLDLAGKHGRATMIRKKWHDGEPVLSVETEDEFWKALTIGEAVELTWELGEQIGLMEDGTITVAEAEAARNDPSD